MANDEKLSIDINLVKNLITTQFPQWAHLPIKPVQFSGWDNKTFRKDLLPILKNMNSKMPLFKILLMNFKNTLIVNN